MPPPPRRTALMQSILISRFGNSATRSRQAASSASKPAVISERRVTKNLRYVAAKPSGSPTRVSGRNEAAERGNASVRDQALQDGDVAFAPASAADDGLH
jgi:hypothetical protein